MTPRSRTIISLTIGAALLLPQLAIAAGVQVESRTAVAGSSVEVTVRLTGVEGDSIAGAQLDIKYDPSQVRVPFVAENENKPNCRVNPAIDKLINVGSEEQPELRGDFGFGFLKDGVVCNPTTDTCDTVRAIVVSTENVAEVPVGSDLFTCTFQLQPGLAVGTEIALTVLAASEMSPGAIGSDPAGQRVDAFEVVGGVITVSGAAGCIGDCNERDGVSLGELRVGVNIFTGSAAISTCQAGYPSGMSLGALRQAVNNFVGGCGG